VGSGCGLKPSAEVRIVAVRETWCEEFTGRCLSFQAVLSEADLLCLVVKRDAKDTRKESVEISPLQYSASALFTHTAQAIGVEASRLRGFKA
jgi:hypothetical protein